MKAIVEVTLPLASIAEIAATNSNYESASLKSDVIPVRVAAILRSGNDNQAPLIKIEKIEFPLFDDGTGSDGTANDHL